MAARADGAPITLKDKGDPLVVRFIQTHRERGWEAAFVRDEEHLLPPAESALMEASQELLKRVQAAAIAADAAEARAKLASAEYGSLRERLSALLNDLPPI